MRRRLSIVIAVAVIFGVSARAAYAAADPAVTCRAAIGKGAAAFAQAKMKVLQKCAESRFKGKKITPTQAGPLADCHADQKTQDAIGKAQSKATGAIQKACCGKDKACGSPVPDADDVPLNAIGWDTVSNCPGFEAQGCTNLINDFGDIAQCVTCIAERAVDQAIDLSYGELKQTNPKDKNQKALNKCQIAIGKNAAAFFGAKSKALQKCWNTVNKGKLPGPCPDDKTKATIEKALGKVDTTLCKVCGGADKKCLGDDNQDTSSIGVFPDCPPVFIPGPGGHTCSHAITSLQELVDCVECVNEFKVDCATLVAFTGISGTYPSECNAALPATPTPTATPALTATSTAATGTPTPTTTAPVPTVTQTPTNGHLCPSKITFTGTSTNAVLDTGWTGLGHRSTVVSDGTATVAVTSCADPAPGCGVCTYTGPIPNAAGQIQNQRCSLDSSVSCTSDADCSGIGVCKFFFGSYLPLTAGGVSTCVENTFSGTLTGTANLVTGDSTGAAALTSRVFNGIVLSHPCPRCIGDLTPPNDGVKNGTCEAGGLKSAGAACDASGSSPNTQFGTTSLDCPPNPDGVIATLPIDLSNTTGTKARTLSASNPNCRAPAFAGATCGGGQCKCQCDTCNNAAATPCSTNADCTAVGATICGGKRCVGGSNIGAACTAQSECPGGACTVPGQTTQANACSDQICSPTNTCVGGTNTDADCSNASECPGGSCAAGNKGTCAGGPSDLYCGPTETFRSCGTNSDCTFAGDTCTVTRFRRCFDSGILGEAVLSTGQADVPVNHQSDPTLAALFCIGPTSAPAVNTAAGLPGLGRLELKGHATDNGS
jgi:hypothetical protein